MPTRLNTAMRPNSRGSLGKTVLNTMLHVEDRPITQQGFCIS